MDKIIVKDYWGDGTYTNVEFLITPVELNNDEGTVIPFGEPEPQETDDEL